MAARSDLGRLVLNVADRIARAPGGALRVIEQAISRTVDLHADRLIQQSIAMGGMKRRKKRAPVDTGDYKRAWRIVRLPDRIEIVSFASPRVKAGVIELGRRPAWIPIAPLAEWVRRKLNVQDPDEARGIAFVISRAASKNPREGLGILAWVRPKLAAKLEDELTKAFAAKTRIKASAFVSAGERLARRQMWRGPKR